ncbi:MAG: hypothetical protein PHG05_04595 [Candidatus Nanoarchaeia archaeon]|nr:hypothetical protein [Candidatus Nanoarchaeia archaeon]
MKKIIYIFTLIILVSLVLAKTESIDLELGQSYLIDNKNITLLRINPQEDKVILCINNENVILSEDAGKNLRNIVLELKNIYSNEKIRLKMDSTCKDCKCDENCLNSNCYKTTAEITGGTTIINEIEQEQKPIELEVKNYKPKIVQKETNLLPVTIVIILLIIIALIAIAIRKKE